MFKGLANIGSMLKQAQEIGGRLNAVNEDLKHRRAVGSSGGGMVEVEVNGLGQVLRVTIEPALIERRDKEMLEDLLPAAFNQAAEKAKALHAEAIKAVTGGFNLPGMEQMFGDLGGAPGDQPTSR